MSNLYFNEPQILLAQHPALRHVERWLASSYRFLHRRAGARFAVAYAAGFEATAFAAARWMDRRRHSLFHGADEVPSTLILWHLAEEVEHKTVAHDVWAAVDGAVEAHAFDVLHDDGPAAAELDQAVDPDDGAVAQQTEEPRLVAQALGDLVHALHVGVEDLQRHLFGEAAGTHELGAVDGAEAALSEHLVDPVLPRGGAGVVHLGRAVQLAHPGSGSGRVAVSWAASSAMANSRSPSTGVRQPRSRS